MEKLEEKEMLVEQDPIEDNEKLEKLEDIWKRQ